MSNTLRKLFCAATLLLAVWSMAFTIDNYHQEGDFPLLVPSVQKLSRTGDAFALPEKLVVSAPEELTPVLRQLNDTTTGKFGIQAIRSNDNAQCVLTLTADGVPANDQGYTLDIDAKGIHIAARTCQGLYYGVQTLRNLLDNSAVPRLPGCSIQDWPGLEWRGYHLDCKTLENKNVPLFCKFFETMGSLKFNAVQLCFGANLPFQDSPFQRKETLTQESLDMIMRAAEENYVTIIPQLQLITHASWLADYPNFYEEVGNKKTYKRFWDSSICIKKPKAIELSKYGLRETVRLMRPQYLHVCLDEFNLCQADKCDYCESGRHTPEELAATMTELLDYTKGLGVIPIVYQDEMLLQRASFSPTAPALLKAMPRDVILDFWDYDVVPHRSHYEFLKEQGFETIVGVSFCNKVRNTRSLPLMTKELGGKGIILTYWGWVWSHFTRQDRINNDAAAGTALTAEYGWNPDNKTELQELTWDPAFLLRRRMSFGHPERTVERNYAAIPLQRHFNGVVGKDLNFFSLNRSILEGFQQDAARAPEHYQLLPASQDTLAAILVSGGMDKYSRETVTVPLQGQMKGISLLLTAGLPGDASMYSYANHMNRQPMFTFKVNYTDGTSVEEETTYRWHYNCWNSEASGIYSRFVLRGPDANTRLCSLYAYDWENPHPEKALKSFQVIPACKSGAATAIFAAVAVDPLQPVPKQPQGVFLDEFLQTSTRHLAFDGGIPADCQVKLEGDVDGELKYTVRQDANAPCKSYLELVVPPKKALDNNRTRLYLDFPIPKGTPVKSFFARYAVDDSEVIAHSGFYRGTPKFATYETYYDFHSELASDWTYLLTPTSDMLKEGNAEFKPEDATILRFSLWFLNDKPVTVKIGDVWSNEAQLYWSAPANVWIK